MTAWMIDRYGTERCCVAGICPDMCASTTFGSLLPDRAGCRVPMPRRISTRAVRDGDDYVLTGVKQFISGAGTSGVYVVMARTGRPGAKGISAFIVELGAAWSVLRARTR